MPAVFLDGPAGGSSLSLRTCPHFLRVTTISDGHPRRGRMIDALDQPDDVPEDFEDLHIYVLESGSWGEVFVRPGGRYEYGRYRHLPWRRIPDAEPSDLRDRSRWIAWLYERGNETAVAAGLDPYTPREDER